MRRIARQLKSILEQVPEDFPEGAKLSDIQEVVAAGEYAVALEILCQQIFEFEIRIPRSLHQEITAMATKLKVSASYLKDLPST